MDILKKCFLATTFIAMSIVSSIILLHFIVSPVVKGWGSNEMTIRNEMDSTLLSPVLNVLSSCKLGRITGIPINNKIA